MMHTEIEAKLKVDSLKAVERQLIEQGASLLSEMVQTDSYFDTAERQLTASDQCLRLRSQRSGTCERLFLTHKGAKEPGDYKRRQEVEFEVTDASAAVPFLNALGYEEALVFNKRRHLWRLADCDVALDELPLIGAFVEIEGPNSETISHVQQALGLADVPPVADSYASLIAERLSQLGLKQREIFL